MPKNPLVGSERTPLPGARAVGKADPAERLEVTLVLRHRQYDELQQRVRKIAAGDNSERHLTHEEYARQFGADPTDVQAVRQFASQHGLAVVEEHQGRRAVVLSGTVAQFNDAFGVDLQQFEHPGGSYRGRTGAIQLPDELHGVVTAVLGLDNRPQARPHFRTRPTHGNVQWHSAAASTSFTPTQLAALYNFPAGTGQGECIAIIELGGGYRTTDLQRYFAALQVSQPTVLAASVDHGKNRATGSANGPDGEVMLDIEVAGAIAPGAKIVVYFAPNTDAGFLDAITAAIHDTTNKPSVISISWGGPESNWTQQAMTAFDQAFQAAAAMGITVCAAAGDDGSSDGVGDGADHVDFPASSPFCLACGGTNLQASGSSITQETVWNNGPQSRRDRRRRQRFLCVAAIPGGAAGHADRWRDTGARDARRPRRLRRRRSANRIRSAGRRPEYRHWGNERGGALMGRAHRADQCGKGPARRVHQPASLRKRDGLARHN